MTDLLIFSGQSNMQGECRAKKEHTPVPGCSEYKMLTDTAVPLCDPVGEDIKYDGTEGYAFTDGTVQEYWLQDHVSGKACFFGSTLVPSFAGSYKKTCGNGVLAVHFAKGSTQIKDWLPGTPAYEMLCRKVNGAKKSSADGGCADGKILFVWLQGESDAVFKVKRDEYAQMMTALKNALKADLGVERFGIIRVGRFTRDGRDDEIISAQESVCESDPDFLMLTRVTENLPGTDGAMEDNIPGHYSEKGLEIIGREAGAALAASVK